MSTRSVVSEATIQSVVDTDHRGKHLDPQPECATGRLPIAYAIG